MAEVHPAMASTTVTNLGQVELDLEINTSGNGNKSAADKGKSKGAATGNGTRKKSSSALQASHLIVMMLVFETLSEIAVQSAISDKVCCYFGQSLKLCPK